MTRLWSLHVSSTRFRKYCVPSFLRSAYLQAHPTANAVRKQLFLLPCFQPGFSYWRSEGECQRAGQTEILGALSSQPCEAWEGAPPQQELLRKGKSCHDKYSQRSHLEGSKIPWMLRKFAPARSVKRSCYNSIRGKALETNEFNSRSPTKKENRLIPLIVHQRKLCSPVSMKREKCLSVRGSQALKPNM